MTALEASAPRGKVRRVRSVHQEHTPEHVVVIEPDEVGSAAEVIRCRIRRAQHAGGGAYLFIDEELRAYVLTDLQSIAATWLREHFDWLVGYYASKQGKGPNPYLEATQQGLIEDVGQHLADLREAA